MVSGGKQEKVSFIIEVTESVICEFTCQEVTFRRIVGRIDGSAGWPLGLEVAGGMAPLPRVESVETENLGTTTWAPLLGITKVGLG